MSNEGVESSIRFTCGDKRLTVGRDDHVIFWNFQDTAQQEHINQLQIQMAKADLKILFEKTEFITNTKQAPTGLDVGQGKIKPTNVSDICMSRLRRMEMIYWLSKDVYNKRLMFRNSQPQTLPDSHPTVPAMHGKVLMETLEVKERNILKKISDTRNGEYRKGHNHELYTHVEKIIDVITENGGLHFMIKWNEYDQ